MSATHHQPAAPVPLDDYHHRGGEVPTHHERPPQVRIFLRATFTNRQPRAAAKIIALPMTDVWHGRGRHTHQYQTETVLGSTEPSTDATNPVWKTPITVDFHFEMQQRMGLSIQGQGADRVLWHQFLLSSVVSGRRSTLRVEVDGIGTVWMHAEAIPQLSRDTASFNFGAAHLRKMGWISACDPYYLLYKLLPNGERKLLHRALHAQDTQSPNWAWTPALRLTDLIVGEDFDNRCLQIECWHDGVLRDGKLGQFKTSLRQLLRAGGVEEGTTTGTTTGGTNSTRYPATVVSLEAPQQQQQLGGSFAAAAARAEPAPTSFQLVHATKPKAYGDFVVRRAQVAHYATFTEFLRAGMEVNLAVAIDFTASNGDPRDVWSLHHRSSRNPYERAISSVADILVEYDTDNLIPAFGFGAKLPHAPREVNHCFHLNGQPDPHVHGLQGILEAYRRSLSAVTLSGPTNFAPTIRQATRAALASPGSYTILLIITDGIITDTDDTIDAIVDAGNTPLSIIIVGVGNADFSVMRMIDGDHVRLTNRHGTPAARDLVQFVAYREFESSPRWALAAEVLAEVPRQVEDWARANRIEPRTMALARRRRMSVAAATAPAAADRPAARQPL